MRQTTTNQRQIDNWHGVVTSILSTHPASTQPMPIADEHVDDLIDYLQQNGIAALIIETLEQNNYTAQLPERLLQKLLKNRRQSAIKEMYKKEHLLKTLDLLAEHQIRCLILKGTALAYSLYQKPYLRPRVDCDLLIARHDKQKLEWILNNAGFNRSPGISGTLISHQATYSQQQAGMHFHYDIHWKISNRNAYADRFVFNDLYQRRTKLDALSDQAYCLNKIDALLHAIVHYYGHISKERERLIWLYDLHLFIEHFNTEDWQLVLKQSDQLGLDPMLLKSLIVCQQHFNSDIPETVVKQLGKSKQTLTEIEQRRVSGEPWSRVEQFKSDWASLTFSKRCLLIKEYLFPPAEFVLQQNNAGNIWLLPYYYIKRLVKGGMSVFSNSNRK